MLKLGHGLPTTHAVHKAMLFMADRVKARSEGQMVVQVFPNEQLGNEKECIEALQLGYLAMTKVSSAPMESFVNKMKVFGVPYLFRDSEHFWVLTAPLAGSRRWRRIERGAAVADGARSFHQEPMIHSPADLSGLKIRVQNSIMAVKMMQAMGGSATPIPFGELYTALDQGVVDGAENNAPSFVQARHYEVCGYYTLDEHTCLPDILMIGTRVWKKLSAEQRQILQEAADESVRYQRTLWLEQEQKDPPGGPGGRRDHPPGQGCSESVRPIWDEFDMCSPEAG